MSAADRPFIVYALPRSRTAWLSAFLSFRGWRCDHEQAASMRSLDQAREFLNRPRHGSAETAVAPGWRLIKAMAPGIREVVILRPVEDAIESCLRLDLASVGLAYDVAILRRNFAYLARCLEQIAARPGVLTLTHSMLDTEEGCRAVFEHCLPFRFERGWWLSLKDRNVQMNVPEHLRTLFEHRAEIDAFKRECRGALRRLRAGTLDRREAA